MTIALGFPYSDGIMVCSDSQMTYPTGAKYTDHKIFAGEIEEFPCIFAFADQSGLANEIKTKIFKKLARLCQESGQSLSIEDACGVVESIMNEQGRLYVDLPLEFFLAAYPQNEEPAIIHFDGKSVNVKTNDIVTLGCGNEPLRNLCTGQQPA